ncbi:MAG: alkaline phosphatase, partial [Phycisphaerales bacterium]|nr:alkaline phosphatase [Phycisphaerales bacterium]
MLRSRKHARRRREERRRCGGAGNYVTEPLERRIVLSGAHDAALLAAIDGALLPNNSSGIAAWATKLNDSSALGRGLPLVGTGVGAHYDPGAALKSLFNRLAPSYASLAALSAGLEGNGGIGDGVAVIATRDNLDNLELDAHFLTTTTVQVPIAGPYGVNLSLGGTLSVAATLDFQVTLGAYWDAGSSSGIFYIQDTNAVMQISGNVLSALPGASGALGVVDLNVTGASASLTPTFTFGLIDQSTPGQPGRLTLPEFNATPIPSLVTTSITQAGPTTFTVNFNAALAPSAHALTISWADLAKPTVATSTLNTDPTLSQLASFQSILPTTFSLGLDGVVQTISDATTMNLAGNSPFMATMPLVGKSFGAVLNAQQLLTGALTNHTDSTTNAQNQQVLAFSTGGQLLTLLRGLPGVGAANASITTTANDIRVSLTLPASSVQSLPINLGIDSQLNLPLGGTMSVSVSTTTTITFGVDTNNQFFILDTGSPVLSATFSGTAAVNGNTHLGFLGVTITNGTMSMTGSAALALHDPNTDNPPTPGVISSNEMVAANLNAMAGPSVSGTASASLPLTTNLAAMSSANGTLGVSWADVKQAQTFTLNTAAVTQFVNFNNITPDVALNGLKALPAVLNHAGDSAFLGENLGFFGSSIGAGVTLGTVFQNVVNSITNITTAQDLQTALNGALLPANVTVTVTASDIEFALTASQSIPSSLKWAVNVTEPTSTDVFQNTGTISATGTNTANILVGLGFAPALSATDRFYVIPGSGSKISASFTTNPASITHNADATLGYLHVGVNGGSGTVSSASNPANNATLTVPFVVPGGGTQLTLTKLQNNAPTAALGTPVADGKAQTVIPIVSGLPSPGASPQITIAWADISHPGTVVVTPQGLGDLSSASNYNATSAQAGLTSVIQFITGWGNVPQAAANVPLAGQPLKSVWDFVSKGTSFFQAILNNGVSTPTAFDNSVQTAIAHSGLDAGSVSLTPKPDNNPATGVFHYLLNFHYNVAGISEPFAFGSNLFSLNGNVSVGVQFNANIEFGLDKTSGFYIVDNSSATSPEVSLTTSVTGNFDKIGGTFGPVSYGVSNGTASIHFNLGLDLVSPKGAGGKIGPGDMAATNNNAPTVVQGEFLSGSGGTLDLPIGFYLGDPGSGPGAATEFKANWNPSNPGALYFGTGNSTNPADGFGPVQFELGDFFNQIVGPVLQKIQQYDPLPQKLVDILNYELPLLGKTPGEILGNIADQPGFDLLFKLAGLVSQANGLLGAGGTLNLSQYLATAPNTGTLPAQAGQGGTSGEQSPFSGILNTLRADDLTFPVLDNPAGSIINLLLGQNVKLVEFNPGKLEVSQSVESPKITIPVFSIGFADASVTAQIGGSVGFFVNLDLGLDSSGLTGNNIYHEKNLLDGFFIGNQDHFQVGFEGSVFLDLGGQIDFFGIPAVSVYGRLGLALDIGAHIDDVRYVAPNSVVPVAPPNGEVGWGESGGDGIVTAAELRYLTGVYGLSCTVVFGWELSLFGCIGFKGPDIPFIGAFPYIFNNLGS